MEEKGGRSISLCKWIMNNLQKMSVLRSSFSSYRLINSLEFTMELHMQLLGLSQAQIDLCVTYANVRDSNHMWS